MAASSFTSGALNNVPSEKDSGEGSSGEIARYGHSRDQSDKVKAVQCMFVLASRAMGSVPSIPLCVHKRFQIYAIRDTATLNQRTTAD